ncbi:MAG TPA: TonB-dependent receptor [Vicinamibacterales bacterium]
MDWSGRARWRVAVFCLSGIVGLHAHVVAGQSVAVTGRVVDAVSGGAVADAKVAIGSRTIITDAEGRFRLDVSAGRLEIDVQAREYLPRTIVVDASSQGVMPIEIQLVPRRGFETHVEVAAPEPPREAPEGPASLPLRSKQVLSTAGSLDNPFRTLQTLPGVAGTDEFGSKLSVRGGAPDQNLTLMDGVEIHNPYRLFGLTSAFNPETIERFELLAGGFGAKYGDRLSSVVLVENRDGNASRPLGGSASASITDANIIGEGLLPGPGRGSWLGTARRTYYDLVAERVVHQDLPSFNDLQIKTAWQLPGSRRLSLLGLRSRELTRITPETDTDGRADIQSRNDLLTATLASPGRFSSTSIIAWSRNTDLIDIVDDAQASSSSVPGSEPDQFTRQLSIDDLSIREEIGLPPLGRHRLEAGTEWHRLQTHVAFRTFDDRDPFGLFRGGAVWLGGVFPERLDHSRSTARGGAWIEDRVELSSVATLVPGLRWDWSGLNGRASVSPRLRGVVALNAATRLTGAAGLYTQSPGYEKLLQADHFTDLTAAGRLNLRPERATHAVGGLDRDIAPGILGRVEVYYKRFTDLIVGRLETEDERLARLARYDFPVSLQPTLPIAPMITSVPTNDGRGRAYGLDVFLSRADGPTHPRLTGWFSYSLGKTQQDIYGRRVPFSYDRRHSMSVVWNWRVDDRWELAGTARVASGFPWTPPSGVRVETREIDSRLVPALSGPNRVVLEVAPGGVAELNSARMPMFARVDLRFAYRPRGASGRWELYVEILNALNHTNAWFMDVNLVDRTSLSSPLSEEPVGGFPRLPTFGLRFRFR